MRKGTIKVINGRNITTIQETLDGMIKSYTPEGWKKELARRAEKEAKQDIETQVTDETQADEISAKNDSKPKVTPKARKNAGKKTLRMT